MRWSGDQKSGRAAANNESEITGTETVTVNWGAEGARSTEGTSRRSWGALRPGVLRFSKAIVT